MKKILNIIILFAAVVFCGCSDFDDSELRGRIDGYKNRIEALKAKAEMLGKQLADLSYLTNGNVITTVSQDADGKYVVTYKDNKDVEHTVVLATMDDIVDVPIIGVKLDENGVYYWTKCIDGEITWLTDDDGEKFPVSGYTPTISVDADGCWTVDGVQILDASGNPIKATTDATSVFRSAELDGDGNFSLTLGDGSTITLRVFNSLNLKLDAMPVTTVADPSKSITVSYELSGEAKETAIVAVAKAEGLDAVIDRDAKTVTVSFDASFSRGTVIVMAYDLADNVIVKPLFYKAATLGTVAISTPDQLVAFAAAVNAGGEEAAAKAVLTQDIDMKDVAWTPIGNGAYTTANAMTGPAFQGTFDGQGHTVRNLKIVVPADAAAGSAWGLFGVLKGATVRNLAIGEGSSVVSTAAAMTAVGAVAGYAYEATIENCENRAAIDIQGGGDNVRESAGGIVGAICANENDSHILSCTNYGKITSKNSVNTKNGATGFSIGGIVGFADASTTTERYNNVVGCVNEGAIDAQATRTAGVVATMNKYTKLESCVNNAAVTCSDVTASNSRVAGIVSAMGGHTYLTSCVNNGTVAFAVAGDTTHGYAAGIAGQTNDNNTAIDGCENYGAVLSDIINAAANKYIGIVCANTNKKTIAIRNCKIGGRIGPFSDGQQGATEITEQNFEQYIYFTLTGGGVPTLENNSFSGGPAKPGIATVEDLTAFRDAVNAGESTAQWEDAGGVVSLLGDIDMKDVAGWTPIGNASYKWEKNLLTIEGNAFKGTFDGQGYALKNLKLAYGGSAANTAYGLFGVLDGATVRNLTVGAALGDASALKVTASGGTAEVGVIAGVCRDANVSDCVNYAKIEYDGTSAARVSAAMVGFIFSETEGTKLERLQNYGAVEADTHGKSTWEAGDRITVVYDGAAYEYTAAEAGPTTAFTSEAGIADYDASKALTAYYPATTAEGVVAVEAERTIALDAESQSNPARAPLVGLPTSGNLAEGALEVTFRNIFSVIELRIDAGELASAAQSLTVEPADEGAFEGFLSFEGTVDPETLALTPAENGTGNSLIFNFAEGVDLTKPQTIKFPVGRFKSEAGLRLTLNTADGKSYSKNIYKTGITSYAEQGGVFRAKHMAKALYAFAPQGGISTADDLIEFAAAVNAGETLAPWQDDKGVVVLLDDIDLAEVTEWTPIGAATSKLASNALSITSGRPFTGYFDGQGHTIRNLKMVCKAAQATSAWGFFGAVANGAVVENLIFDASCSLEDKATAGTDCGVVAGLVYEATVRNVVNKAPISFDGAAPDNIRMTIGMVGLAFADKNGARLEKLVNHGALTATSGGNTKNGATGIHVGGIVGFSSNKSNTMAVVTIAECANYGDLDTQVARASGIVAAANRYTEIENCVNEGDNVNAFATVNSARIGNITCITAVGSKITNTVNRGNVICKTGGAAGGIVCLVNDDGNAFVGCENYGLVITDRANYKGTLFGQCNKAARFSDCIAQGDLGAYEDGSYALVGVNYTNYMSYIGDHNATAVHVNSQNILYYPNGSQVPAEPEFGVNLSSVELNAQGSNAAVVQLSSVDYDWTVSADGDWAHITDLSDVPVVSGVKDPGVQYIKIGADANTKTSPRSAVVTFASTDGSKSATVRVDQQARGEAFPSKWVFQASTLPLYGSSWTDDNVIPATSGAAGFISVVRGDANASAAFKRSVVTNRPAVSTMVEGDYWLYTFPVENLAAGSVVDFNATMAGEANSPKYFIVEYLDGGVWKSVEADLLTAPENPAVRYTYKCSGTATGSSYQHATVMQTMRFENAVTDGEVKIRCRAVGPYTCAGGTQNITATNAASSIPPYGFTGSYVQNFGTATPRDTKKVLCLGNSFSYYSNPAWMLKEIAWREGHALNIKAHFKGSQTLTQHLSLGFSTDVIEQGGYDFAFLQDQSQNPANYGRDATASILTGLTTLADKVRAASPSCKVILEETWTFSSASYGGFTDFPTFETYNDAGAKAMAKAAGTWVSPIGPAFRQVREGGSGINLYYSDSKHQSEYGAYLKACVNYLVLFGERFGADPADCGLNPDKAAYLRSVAEQIVLGNEEDYFIER